MGYAHAMYMQLKLRPGTEIKQVEDALAPLTQYLGYTNVLTSGTGTDDEFSYDPETGKLEVRTSGEVSYSYSDLVRQAGDNLGHLMEEAEEITLYDYDSPDIEEAVTKFTVGPSKEAIKNFEAAKDINQALNLIRAHMGHDLMMAVKTFLQACAEAKKDGDFNTGVYAPVSIGRWMGETVVDLARFVEHYKESAAQQPENYPLKALRGDFDEQFALWEPQINQSENKERNKEKEKS